MDPSDSLAAARQLLPAWLPWANLALGIASSFLLSLVLPSLGAALEARPLCRTPRASWVERANVMNRARGALTLGQWIALACAVGFAFLGAGPLVPLPLSARMALHLGAFTAGSVLASARLARHLPGEGRGLRDSLRQTLVSMGLGLAFPLALVLAPSLPPADGWATAAVLALALALLLATGVGAHWPLLARLFQWLGWIQGAGDRLEGCVARAARSRGLPVPRRIWRVRARSANAMALFWLDGLLFTDGLLEILDDEELETVAGHELGHLAEPRAVKLVFSLVLLPVLVLAFYRPILAALGPLGLLVALPASVAVRSRLLRYRRRAEERADAIGRAEQAREGVYARALERIHRRELIPVVQLNASSTHPDLYDRMEAAGLTPEYPRPDVEELKFKGHGSNAVFLAAVALLVVSFVAWELSLIHI